MSIPFSGLFTLWDFEKMKIFSLVIIAYLTGWEVGNDNKPSFAETLFAVRTPGRLVNIINAKPRPFVKQGGIVQLAVFIQLVKGVLSTLKRLFPDEIAGREILTDLHIIIVTAAGISASDLLGLFPNHLRVVPTDTRTGVICIAV